MGKGTAAVVSTGDRLTALAAGRGRSARALAVFNPAAAAGRAQRQALQARERLARFLEADWVETDHPLHAAELAEWACNEGYGYIFAVGGDGTVNEVVNGLLRTGAARDERPVVGVLPVGSGNGIHKNLRERAGEATEGLAGLPCWTVDVGLAHIEGYERYFCQGVGIGYVGWANLQHLAIKRVVPGHLGYLVAGATALLTYRERPEMTVTCDGVPLAVERAATLLTVSNAPTLGGGFRVAPDADLTDGKFEVLFAEAMPVWRVAQLVLKARNGAHLGARELTLARASEVRIECKSPQPLHVDGESWGPIPRYARSVTIQVKPVELAMTVLPVEG